MLWSISWIPFSRALIRVLMIMCYAVLCLVTQSCLTLGDSMDSRLLCPWGFSRQEYWSGLPCPPGDLPNPEIEPRSPALQADSLPSESQGNPSNTGVNSLSLLRGIFLIQELNWGLLHCREILYQLSYTIIFSFNLTNKFSAERSHFYASKVF